MNAETSAENRNGGESGIRTHEPRKGLLAFEASSFDHSDISPQFANNMSTSFVAKEVSQYHSTSVYFDASGNLWIVIETRNIVSAKQ